MSEGRPSISSSRLATGDVAQHSFTVVRRGYDTDEVRAYLQTVARSIDAIEHREEELRLAIAQAEERAAHPVIDEATLTASLGQHSAQVLRHAHEEAARIVAQAQESSAALLREAQNAANEIQEQSEVHSAERVAETELMVATAEEEARVEATRIHADAVGEADEIIARAKDEGRALLEQVQVARKRVLADMATRRRGLSIQIEQLRAARDEMAASIHGVRDSVDGILSDLQRSDDDARSAAAAAADGARLHASSDHANDVELSDLEPSTESVTSTAVPEAASPTGAEGEPQGEEDQTSGSGESDVAVHGGAKGTKSSTREAPTQETPVASPIGGTTGDGAHEVVSASDAPSVDELFARIRAGTDVDPATTAPPTAAVAAQVAASEEEPTNPDQDLIDQRNELLAPITLQLSRHIKRALGDDQNRLLDVLRSSPTTNGEALLGTEDEHLAFFTSAAFGHLTDAVSAGAKFAGGKVNKGPAEAAAAQAASALARNVVTMLRRRIEATDSGEDVSARVGAAFREWRGERIERLVGDCAVQSFSAGVLAGVTKKGVVRWVLTSTDGCSDCDDNALAGAVSVAEGFPTGHAAPPAHAGCRCLITPATA